MKATTTEIPWLATVLMILFLASASFAEDVDWAAGEFAGSKEEVETFMTYNRAISLDESQEATRKAALGAIPAPCCSEYSAATCCCECNLTRSIWGLSKYLITEKDASVEQVQRAAQAWIDVLNPDGFSGDACFTGGCNKPFSHGGCGGMREKQLRFE